MKTIISAILVSVMASSGFIYAQKIESLPTLIHEGVICYVYPVQREGESLTSIAQLDNRLNLDTLLHYNRVTVQNQASSPLDQQRPKKIKLAKNTMIYYPKRAILPNIPPNMQDTTTYEFKIIDKNNSSTTKRVAISDLKLTTDQKYAIVKTGDKLKKISEKNLLVPATFYAKQRGSEDVISIEIIVSTIRKMQFNREEKKFEGEFSIMLREKDKSLIQSQQETIENPIRLNFETDYAIINPEEVELTTTYKSHKIKLSDKDFTNPLKISINADSEYEHLVYKQPVINFVTNSIKSEDYSSQSVTIELKLLSYFQDMPAKIIFSSTNPGVTINPDKIELNRNIIGRTNLIANKSAVGKLIASGENFLGDTLDFDITIKQKPFLVISPTNATLEGYGIESKDVFVGLNNYTGKDSVEISLSIDNASVVPNIIYLSKIKTSKNVKIKSQRIGIATLQATSSISEIEPGRAAYSLKFPWMFLIFSLLGGLIGGIIRIFMKLQDRKVFSTLFFGCVIGFVVAILYMVLKINLFTFEIEPTYSGFLVLGISFLGVIFWETIYSSLSKFMRK